MGEKRKKVGSNRLENVRWDGVKGAGGWAGGRYQGKNLIGRQGSERGKRRGWRWSHLSFLWSIWKSGLVEGWKEEGDWGGVKEVGKKSWRQGFWVRKWGLNFNLLFSCRNSGREGREKREEWHWGYLLSVYFRIMSLITEYKQFLTTNSLVFCRLNP